MNDEANKLWELQQVVTQLEDYEKQMNTRPESFAEVDTEFQAANAEVEKLKESLESIARERRRVDGELADQQEVLKKYQGQLMQVKNQQQYAAAWKEIDSTRKHVKELEDAVLKSMGDSDAIQKQLDERAGGYDDLKARHDAAFEAWQSSLGELRGLVEALRAKRAKIESSLPERLTREFWRIAKQRHSVAVAAVDGDTCSSCRTRIRPALSQRLRRGELLTCEGCARILHMERSTS